MISDLVGWLAFISGAMAVVNFIASVIRMDNKQAFYSELINLPVWVLLTIVLGIVATYIK